MTLSSWLKSLEKEAPKLALKFSAASVRHVVIDNFLEEDFAAKLAIDHEICMSMSGKDANAPKKHRNVGKKIGLRDQSRMSKSLRDYFTAVNSSDFTRFLSLLTGIPEVFSDESLEGGGLHQIHVGGFLNLHTDFNVHPRNDNWYRALNLLLYLNLNWENTWHGELSIYDSASMSKVANIEPVFNRAVLFETSERALHGHPEPLCCPNHVHRNSLATYYYMPWPPGQEKRRETGYVLSPEQIIQLKVKISDLTHRGLTKSEILVELSSEFEIKTLLATHQLGFAK